MGSPTEKWRPLTISCVGWQMINSQNMRMELTLIESEKFLTSSNLLKG